MSNLRNFLLTAGLYWLSTWLAFLLFIVFPNAHVYTESPLNAIVFGMEMGMGRAVAAACADPKCQRVFAHELESVSA